ncbi:MAG: hypothetical protein IH945_04580 [Armatimonadetes bacterium]|nr:hypothetical protein [Armatimonadota bacterium]
MVRFVSSRIDTTWSFRGDWYTILKEADPRRVSAARTVKDAVFTDL